MEYICNTNPVVLEQVVLQEGTASPSSVKLDISRSLGTRKVRLCLHNAIFNSAIPFCL